MVAAVGTKRRRRKKSDNYRRCELRTNDTAIDDGRVVQIHALIVEMSIFSVVYHGDIGR